MHTAIGAVLNIQLKFKNIFHVVAIFFCYVLFANQFVFNLLTLFGNYLLPVYYEINEVYYLSGHKHHFPWFCHRQLL